MTLRPLGSDIIVEPRIEKQTDSGILLVQAKRQPTPNRGTVIAIGPKVKTVKPGDDALFSITMDEVRGLRYEDKKYLSIDESNVLGLVCQD